MNIYKTINAVQKDLTQTGITKNQTNSFDRYNFRGIDDVYNALAPLLAKHGLLIMPRMMSRDCQERTATDGKKAMFYVTVEAEFDFVCAEDGSIHTVKTYGEAMDRSDKATNKAMSAAYKYAAFQAFCIPTEAHDADSETPQVQSIDTRNINREQMQDTVTCSLSAIESDDPVAMRQLWDELKEDEQKFVWSFFSSRQKESVRELLNRAKD